MKKELIKLANHLDRVGLVKEADYVDRIIKNADDEFLFEDDFDTLKYPGELGSCDACKGDDGKVKLSKVLDSFPDQVQNDHVNGAWQVGTSMYDDWKAGNTVRMWALWDAWTNPAPKNGMSATNFKNKVAKVFIKYWLMDIDRLTRDAGGMPEYAFFEKLINNDPVFK